METNVIYNMDNVEGLQEKVPDESIDLTVTSPPYDDLRTYYGAEWEFEPLAEELYRVTKQGGVVVWIIGDQVKNKSETGSSFRQALYFKDEVGFNIHDTMIYRKKGISFPDPTRYFQCFQYMFILSKETPKTINFIKDRKNNGAGDPITSTDRQKNGDLVDSHGNKNNRTIKDKSRRFNIWTYNTGHGHSAKEDIAFNHPAIFPEKLAEDHIRSWSNKGNLVLDPFIGSGTTAKMAKKLDRKYVGFEVNQEYCEIAERRVSEVQRQLI